MAAEPVVSRLENEFGAGLLVLKVNVQSQAGRELSVVYGSRVTPTFILFDGSGTEVWRGLGGLNADRISALLDN